MSQITPVTKQMKPVGVGVPPASIPYYSYTHAFTRNIQQPNRLYRGNIFRKIFDPYSRYSLQKKFTRVFLSERHDRDCDNRDADGAGDGVHYYYFLRCGSCGDFSYTAMRLYADLPDLVRDPGSADPRTIKSYQGSEARYSQPFPTLPNHGKGYHRFGGQRIKSRSFSDPCKAASRIRGTFYALTFSPV